MATLQVHFADGPVVRLSVSAQLLLSMLELRPGMAGVAFRKDLKFAVVQEGGPRRMMSTLQIYLVEEQE